MERVCRLGVLVVKFSLSDLSNEKLQATVSGRERPWRRRISRRRAAPCQITVTVEIYTVVVPLCWITSNESRMRTFRALRAYKCIEVALERNVE